VCEGREYVVEGGTDRPSPLWGGGIFLVDDEDDDNDNDNDNNNNNNNNQVRCSY
jgi:phosphate-selective porin